jgi:hypothetical protein
MSYCCPFPLLLLPTRSSRTTMMGLDRSENFQSFKSLLAYISIVSVPISKQEQIQQRRNKVHLHALHDGSMLLCHTCYAKDLEYRKRTREIRREGITL